VIVLRIIVGVAAVAGIVTTFASVLRSVVVPRAIPTHLARVAFLVVRRALVLQLRVMHRTDYHTRDRVFALQAPIGLFAQLFTWGACNLAGFSALFWALSAHRVDWHSITSAIELSGSSMLTLGYTAPVGFVRHLVAFADAALGLILLALVITYLPSLYGAFSRREHLITKLVVRSGVPPSGPKVLVATWELGRSEQLEEVWDAWEDWFIELGETHTTFPQLTYFRSPHPRNHWVLAAESVLDSAALVMTTTDTPRLSRSELCLNAGVHALISIADFLGVPHKRPAADATIALSYEEFRAGCTRLAQAGVPVHADLDASWTAFRQLRARYEPLVALLGRMTDAPRGEWSAWSDDTPRYTPPLLHMRRAFPDADLRD
jgi:hypothetical protein